MQKSHKTFGFHKQKKVGDKGEDLFIEYYKDMNPIKSEDRKYDLIIKDGASVELKTDSYKSSTNFFMEKFGNKEKQKYGGVWRSVLDEVTFFVYYFINENTFYWFIPKTLQDFLDKNENKYQKREIVNYGWSAVGYIVPKTEIKHLAFKIDKF